MTTLFDLKFEQMHVKTVFLYGMLEERICHNLGGLSLKREKDRDCPLNKSLYGFKQSSRQWYIKFDEFMTSNSYCKSNNGGYVYFKTQIQVD